MPSAKKPVSKSSSSKKRSSGKANTRNKKQTMSTKGLWRALLIISLVSAGVLVITLTSFRDRASAYLKNVHSNFTQTESDLGLENGITQEDVPTLLDSAATTAEQLAQDGSITDYEVGDNCVYMETQEGVGMVYAPVIAESTETPAATQIPSATPAVMEETASQVPTEDSAPNEDVPANVLCLQPCYDLFLNNFSREELESVDDAAFRFAQAFDSFHVDPVVSDLDNQSVTPETILTFPQFDIIVWEGHGGYSDRIHSFLFTGQTYTDSYYSQHQEDFQNGNLIATTDGYVAVTAGFFDTYLAPGSLDGTIIYLAACSSCRDSVLVQTLLNKGAAAVYAADGIVYTSYNYAMLDWISIDLCGFNGKIMTTGEALEDAQATYGYLDNYLLTTEAGVDTNGSTICLFGNKAYRLS